MRRGIRPIGLCAKANTRSVVRTRETSQFIPIRFIPETSPASHATRIAIGRARVNAIVRIFGARVRSFGTGDSKVEGRNLHHTVRFVSPSSHSTDVDHPAPLREHEPLVDDDGLSDEIAIVRRALVPHPLRDVRRKEPPLVPHPVRPRCGHEKLVLLL